MLLATLSTARHLKWGLAVAVPLNLMFSFVTLLIFRVKGINFSMIILFDLLFGSAEAGPFNH